MATLVVGDVDAAVDDYGSTHDEELVVPLSLMVQHPRSHPSKIWKMKKVLCAGIIGMTAAVASSAVLFYSILDFSKQASTGPSFLLDARGPYSNCVVASGPWPTNSYAADDDRHDDDDGNNPNKGKPYVTCYSYKDPYYLNGGDAEAQCWSNSYKDGWGNWQTCKPQGYGAGWEFGTPKNYYYVSAMGGSKTPTCGKPCTEFAS